MPDETGKPGPKRTPAQRKVDLAEIEYWVKRGKNQRQIAALLAPVRDYSLSHQMVGHDIRLLCEIWRKDALASINERKEAELAGLQAQEDELWMAWDKSKADAIRKSVSNEGDLIKPATGDEKVQVQSGKQKQSVTQEGQCGDPAYMRLILEVRDRRAKLLGLDEPVKTELAGTMQITRDIKLDSFSDEELNTLERLLRKGGVGGHSDLTGGTTPT